MIHESICIAKGHEVSLSICVHIFSAGLFIVAIIWNQLKSSLVIDKEIYILCIHNAIWLFRTEDNPGICGKIGGHGRCVE